MNHKKGFIGVWIAVAVVAVLTIAGGAYYVGKTSKPVSDNTVPQDIPNDIFTTTPIKKTTTTPVTQTTKSDCKTGDAPWIKVLSPNGGEVYQIGQSTVFKWTSCNLSSNVSGELVDVSNPNGGYALFGEGGPGAINSGSETVTFNTRINPGTYKFMVRKFGDNLIKDYSDSFFTIKNSVVSTTLPKYIGSHADCGLASCWPPVIQASVNAYSCVPYASQGDTVDAGVQKVINGRTYCVMSLGDSYAGGTGWTYTYTTANGTGTKTTTFGITIPSCGGYGSPGDAQYDQCKTNINNFNIDSIVDSLFIASPVSFNIFPLIGDNNGDPHVQNAIEQGKNSAADFSGHYKIVSIGCGTECASSALYDKSTGTISRFDYTMFIGALGTESYPEFPVIGHSASSDILTLNKKAADNSVYVEKWKFSGGVFIKI